MPYRRSCAACALAAALLLSGCSAVTGSDVESLLRAPQASGETSAVQKALNSALGVTATLKYPASGDFLSPLLFGDWDGDGQDEAAVLYTLDASAGNVYLAVLEPTEENGWRALCPADFQGLSRGLPPLKKKYKVLSLKLKLQNSVPIYSLIYSTL